MNVYAGRSLFSEKVTQYYYYYDLIHIQIEKLTRYNKTNLLTHLHSIIQIYNCAEYYSIIQCQTCIDNHCEVVILLMDILQETYSLVLIRLPFIWIRNGHWDFIQYPVCLSANSVAGKGDILSYHSILCLWLLKDLCKVDII